MTHIFRKIFIYVIIIHLEIINEYCLRSGFSDSASTRFDSASMLAAEDGSLVSKYRVQFLAKIAGIFSYHY
jgi:hypothetical protein